MNRKDFLVKAGLLSAGMAVVPHFTFAKDSDTNKKMDLIESLTKYAEEHMELIVKKDFFSKWSENEDFHYYLYVSEADRVECPKGVNEYLEFGTDKAAAISKQKEFTDDGKHTLLYKCEGAHDFRITNALLSNSNEGIALLIFHEASLQHFTKKAKLSIHLEQSACEVMGTFGAKFYAERFDEVELKKVKKLVKLLERAYEVINETSEAITEDEAANDKLYRKLEAKLFPAFKKSEPFIQQRYIHPVNNAYLLKNQYFAKHFSLLKSVAEKDKFINTFLYNLENLPKKEDKALEQLKAKIEKKAD